MEGSSYRESTVYETEPGYNKARYSEHYIKFHCKKERCKPLAKYRRKISVELINPLLAPFS